MWPLFFVFVEPLVVQHYSHWIFFALMELPRWLNIICVDMGLPTFGCTLHFNPWHVDFILGLNSGENQPFLVGWLSNSFYSFGWRLVSLETFCLWPTVFCWATAVSHGQALVILYGLCSWKNSIHEGHGWHSILMYNCCTACANIVHTLKLRMYKYDEPGVLIIPCYVQSMPCSGQHLHPTNLTRGGQVQHSSFLTVLVN